MSADGVRLWYRVAGRSRGVPVVFLHGGPGEGSQVFQAAGGPQLEPSLRLIYLDQRGGGRSERPGDPARYSMAILVEDIERLRRHLGVPRIILLGHSFGTQLALEYAVRHPEHTAALVLAAATPHLLRSYDFQCQRLAREDPEAYARAVTGVRDGAMPRCNMMRAYEGDAARTFISRNLFPDPAVQRRVEAIDNAEGVRSTGEVAGALFRQGLLHYRFDRAPDVRAPVLIIAGGRDFQAAIEVQRDLAQQLPNARLVEYPGAGHFLFVEQPGRFSRDVMRFLREVARER